MLTLYSSFWIMWLDSNDSLYIIEILDVIYNNNHTGILKFWESITKKRLKINIYGLKQFYNFAFKYLFVYS